MRCVLRSLLLLGALSVLAGCGFALRTSQNMPVWPPASLICTHLHCALTRAATGREISGPMLAGPGHSQQAIIDIKRGFHAVTLQISVGHFKFTYKSLQ